MREWKGVRGGTGRPRKTATPVTTPALPTLLLAVQMKVTSAPGRTLWLRCSSTVTVMGLLGASVGMGGATVSGVPARPLPCVHFLSLHHPIWVSLPSQSSWDSIPLPGFPPSFI